MISAKLHDQFLVRPGKKFRLESYDPAWAGGKEYRDLAEDELKERAQESVKKHIETLAEEQERLWAQDQHAVLVVIQAIDAAGKDGLIKHVMSGLNPQGCHVHSFKQPSDEELDHDFLWRCSQRLPPRGEIGIFNRSYYEEVLVVRVHPEYLGGQRLPGLKKVNGKFWRQRYESINDFEKHLARNGYTILKFFLNVSRGEQKKRFLERLDNPEKNWKFSPQDVKERAHWDAYMQAFEEALGATSTKHAPWYVIPADHKWIARSLVAGIIAKAIEDLPLAAPTISAKERAAFAETRQALESEAE
ncbi:MAG: polyphosphate kinase 2 family protein [Acidobacteria bacterium]|nr:polyphosphate kinase 2 family protein [Acidobacteriota bacterium]